MAKSHRPWTPSQSYLLPPSPAEWLPEDHLAYFVLELVEELGLGAIERAVQAKDHRGERPYAPRTALRLRDRGVLFEEDRARKLGQVAIDGTKMKANASKHKAMSYDRMVKDDARLTAEIEALMVKAEAADTAEDAQFGAGEEPQDLPAELRRREDRLAKRLAKIREVRAALKAETAAARAAQLRAQAEELRAKAAEPATPPNQQRAFTTLAAKRDERARSRDHEHDRGEEEGEEEGTGTGRGGGQTATSAGASRYFTMRAGVAGRDPRDLGRGNRGPRCADERSRPHRRRPGGGPFRRAL